MFFTATKGGFQRPRGLIICEACRPLDLYWTLPLCLCALSAWCLVLGATCYCTLCLFDWWAWCRPLYLVNNVPVFFTLVDCALRAGRHLCVAYFALCAWCRAPIAPLSPASKCNRMTSYVHSVSRVTMFIVKRLMCPYSVKLRISSKWGKILKSMVQFTKWYNLQNFNSQQFEGITLWLWRMMKIGTCHSEFLFSK